MDDHDGGFRLQWRLLQTEGRRHRAKTRAARPRTTQTFAVGDAETILSRVAEYVDAGVSKFILRPLGCDDEAILAQTRLLIEQVLPRAETRWPRA
jgi:alkanesulfonate monooxygenase SsuD/methylene tetrahydromethanopterin reductase-like flavin-dependent oxidoreductase (luciferase family)